MSIELKLKTTAMSAVLAAGSIYVATQVPPGGWHDFLMVGGGMAIPPVLNSVTGLLGKRQTYEHLLGDEGNKNRILAIRVDGVIVGERPPGPASMFGNMISGYEIQETLIKAAENKTIKAVIMQFMTPGGTIPGAQAIHDGIMHFRRTTKRPVIAHIEGMCASGGVYAMIAADHIFAEPGSLVGSIGVTLGTRHWYDDPMTKLSTAFEAGVETRGGVHSYVLAAGKGKDLLSEWRAPDAEELDVLKAQLEQMYGKFVDHVATQRGIDPNVIRDEMGAYVFANPKAESLKLIDGTKTRRETVVFLTQKLGLKKFAVVEEEPEKKGFIQRLIGMRAPISETKTNPPMGAMMIAPSLLNQWRV